MKYMIKNDENLKQIVNNMELEELLHCVICPHDDGANFVEGDEKALAHSLLGRDAETMKAMIKKIRETNPYALFPKDLEAGAGRAVIGLTRFPSLMACGVINDEELTYKMGEICAAEAKEVGVDWAFAPCVDIAFNHDCPIVSTRCPSDDPETVLKIGKAYINGLQDNGIIATLKHFPGDGICKFDQHLTTPENPLSWEEWQRTYGRVYKELIENGVKAIMPGHIALPAYDDKIEEIGAYPPATLSKKLLTDLLKNELGFDGIIVSDAANMGGFCGFMNYYDACCTFLQAGGDCLLFVHYDERFVNGFKRGIEKGLLDMQTLRNRAYRMLCFAKEHHEQQKKQQNISREYAQSVSNEVVEKAMRVIRDRKYNIPFHIQKDTKILHLSIHNNYDEKDVTRLTEELKKVSDFVDERNDLGPNEMRELVEDNRYDLIVCTIGCQPAFGINSIRLHGSIARNMMLGWTKFDTPVIFVNYGNPYLEEEYKVSIDTLINTYGCTDYTAEAVVKLIMGKENEEITK